MESTKIARLALLGIVALIGIVMFFMSWKDVNPGEEGFIYRPFGGGINEEEVPYPEGTIFIAPWNELITYNILQESKNYKSTVMDKNGTDITVNIAVNYAVKQGNSASLHLTWGKGYIPSSTTKLREPLKM